MIDSGLALARWAFFAASSSCLGLALFPLYAFRAIDGLPHARLNTGALMTGFAGATLFAALAWLVLIIVSFGGDDLSNFVSTAGVVLFNTGFGPAWLARLGAGLALFVAAVLRFRSPVLLVLAAVVLGSEGCLGHAADGWTHGSCQTVHVLAVGAWLGGLIGLSRVLSDCPQVPTTERLVCVLLRFSTVGVVSVAAIAATGALNTWLVLGRLPDASGAYDGLVLLKAGLFFAMLSVAAFNRFKLLPLLEHPRAGVLEPLAWLRRAILVEQALGLAVLLAASVLGMTDPFP